MLDLIARIKNVETDGSALCSSQDVGEGETTLVAVPRSKGRRGEVALAGAFQEPDHEGGVEQSDEGSDSEDRCLFGTCQQL